MIQATLAPQPFTGPESAVIGAFALALFLGLVVIVLVLLARRLLYICRPNEVLIFTGRKGGPVIVRPRSAGADDAEPGAGVGHKWRIPILERVDRMDMRTMSVDIVVQNAYSAGNIPLRIHAIANVKIHSDPALLRNAIERFLGRAEDEIRLVAQQTLEGALREVLAQMTPEQVNEDRLTFAENLARSARDDLDKLGLQLDTLKIQNVADDTGYLDSLGRPAIAAALRDAENAENQAMQEIAEAQADANRRSEVARAQAETAIVQKKNELAKLAAELEGKAAAVEREAEVAALTARAQAEQELQQLRSELERKRLQADVVIPAEFRRQAEAIVAKGEAAPTAEEGKAVAEVLAATAAAWRKMGPQAREIYVIQHLEQIVGTIVSHLRRIDVEEVNILDPGDGSGLASYAAAYPQTIAAVLRALAETTGVDVPALLAEGPRGPSARPTNPNATAPQRSLP
ncbi:MAG: flotillin family protein [Deltaproteobacteria bacterium]|nr:MAG: flotillin family protein [Deltaproteobacteria bacterium]